ncbi:MAG: tetratricopeptide repeat protein [Deltaproteobacteria bacterium]|nr:tetratricopeptide repeat protein [Deltaproteobacteria bacterium]
MAGLAMAGVSSEVIDYLFSSTIANSQANLDSLAGNLLGQGIDLYQKGDYGRAISAFRRSAALSPFSDNTAKAYDYMGKAYVKQEKTAEAINVYQEAARIFPTNDEFRLALGDIYRDQGEQEEALKSYEAAVRLNPSSADSRYELGQSYLNAGQFDAARDQFAQVVRLTPTSAAGYYGLGHTARLAGEYQDAVSQLNQAIKVNRNFEKAYIELGYTYADQGDFQKASEKVAELSAKGSSQAKVLELYIAGVAQPQILHGQSSDGFNTALGRATRLSLMDSSLAAPGSTKLFSMSFAFSKDMDRASVINRDNWTITRASLLANRGVYNGGLTPSKTEATILSTPAAVTYDTETNTATIRFRISQNAAADATIDPAHIVFKFYGQDAYGKAMDTSADEYSGFSEIV